MIIFFNVRTKVIYFKNIYRFVTIAELLHIFLLKQIFRHTDRQTNFKLSYGNTINISINMKIRPFQLQKNMEIGALIQK